MGIQSQTSSLVLSNQVFLPAHLWLRDMIDLSCHCLSAITVTTRPRLLGHVFTTTQLWITSEHRTLTKTLSSQRTFTTFAYAGYGFKDEKLSSSAAQKSVKSRLSSAGISSLKTMHGLRRGRVQLEQRNGSSLADIKQLSQIKTDQIVQRYADLTAHVGCLKWERTNRTCLNHTDSMIAVYYKDVLQFLQYSWHNSSTSQHVYLALIFRFPLVFTKSSIPLVQHVSSRNHLEFTAVWRNFMVLITVWNALCKSTWLISTRLEIIALWLVSLVAHGIDEAHLAHLLTVKSHNTLSTY